MEKKTPGARLRAAFCGVATALTILTVTVSVAGAGVSYNGTRGLLRTKSADTIGRGNLNFSLSTHFQRKSDQLLEPGKFFPSSTDSAYVHYMFFTTRGALSYGITDYLELAASLDVRNWLRTIKEDNNTGIDSYNRGGLGDTDLSVKIGFPVGTDMFKIGASGTFSFPTGNKDRRFTTESTDIEILGLATIDLSSVGSVVPTRIHFNSGIRMNRNEDNGYGIFDPNFPDSSGFGPPAYPAVPAGEKDNYNDQFIFATAVEFPTPQATLFVEYYMSTFLNIEDTDLDPSVFPGMPSELSRSRMVLSPGIEFTSASGSSLKFGGDIDLTSGDKPSFTNDPDWGLWLMFSHTAEVVPKDTDGDGINDDDDACVNEPEDFDGFEDADGCPDLDNDNDGFPDVADGCPDLAEDFDGFDDDDGCPDRDNDQDGIADVNDRCPDEPEDFDGVDDTDGCPDLVKDSDNDGIPDDDDRCPLQAEDIDGFQDDDGCPDLDNDLDGIPDDVDNCPNAPETFNGYEDEDGCPDEKPIEAKFVLRGVNFESGSAALTPDSYSVLDEVVRSLQAYPEVKVEIRGHTDSQGPASFNLDLSLRRAESVKQYLVNSGIDPARIVAKGVGEEEPVSTNSTPEGRLQNRRIEFRRLN